MNPFHEYQLNMTRRDLLANSARPLGAAALASLVGKVATAAPAAAEANAAARAAAEEEETRIARAEGALRAKAHAMTTEGNESIILFRKYLRTSRRKILAKFE